MEILKVISNAQKIIELAKEEGWSEEELTKAIQLLHSNIDIYPI